MIVASEVLQWCLIGLCGLLCTGCWENATDSLNEKKEAYFQRGQGLSTSMDWAGAADAFEKALEVNPRNASAHFELCFLHEQHLNDYASAIYHGKRFLKLRPNSEMAEIVRQHISSCVVELAKNVPVGPVTPALQRDFERVVNENKSLRLQLDQMHQKLALATNRVLLAPPPLAPITNAVRPAAPALTATNRVSPAPSNTARGPTPVATKTHTVKERENLAQIARKYGITLSALMNANPGVEPKKLKIGQAIKVPSSPP